MAHFKWEGALPTLDEIGYLKISNPSRRRWIYSGVVPAPVVRKPGDIWSHPSSVVRTKTSPPKGSSSRSRKGGLKTSTSLPSFSVYKQDYTSKKAGTNSSKNMLQVKNGNGKPNEDVNHANVAKDSVKPDEGSGNIFVLE